MARGDKPVKDSLYEYMGVTNFSIPTWLKLANMSHEEGAKEAKLEDVSQLRGFMYRKDNMVPLAIFKALTIRRGMFGMDPPKIVERRFPFRLPKSLGPFLGREPIDFAALKASKEADVAAAAEPVAAPAAAPAAPEPEPIQAAAAAAEPTQEVLVGRTDSWEREENAWPMVFRQTLEYMAGVIVERTLEVEHGKRRLREVEANLLVVTRERDKAQRDYQAAQTLLDEQQPVGPTAAVAQMVAEAVTQAADRNGSPAARTAARTTVSELQTRLGK